MKQASSLKSTTDNTRTVQTLSQKQ